MARQLASSLEVIAVHSDHIDVAGENINGTRRVSRTDFDTIASYWPLYKAGLVPRGKLRDLSKKHIGDMPAVRESIPAGRLSLWRLEIEFRC